MSGLEERIERDVASGRPTCISPSQRDSAAIPAAFLARFLRRHTYQERGVVLIGVKITGVLNLSDLTMTAPLRLRSCRFQRPLLLPRAQLYLLDLRRSKLEGLVIGEAIVEHSLLLDRAVLGATSRTGPVLDGSLLRVGGRLSARNVSAAGTVRLPGATIGGQLTCSGANLNGTEEALDLDRAEVKRSVFLDQGFTTAGTVRLPGATIGGQLNCRGANFKGTGITLSLDGAEVKGGVFLDQGFATAGTVRLLRATIGGQFACRGAHFNGTGDALSLDGAEVKGEVFLDQGFTIAGTARLLGVTIGGQLNCQGANFNGTGDALSLDGAEVKGDVLLDQGFTTAGTVRLPGAAIGGQLNCRGANFKGTGITLSLDGAEVKGDVFLELAWAEPSGRLATDLSAPPGPPRRQLSLRGARLGPLRLGVEGDPAPGDKQLTSTLLLENATYPALSAPGPSNRAKLSWSRRAWSSVCGRSEFEQLPGVLYRAVLLGQQDQQEEPGREVYPGTFDTAARVLREAGDERLARQLLIERHRQLTRRRRPLLARPIGWLLDVTVGYGFRPRLALLWALLVYLGAVLVFAIAVHHGGVVATPLAGTSGSPSPLESTPTYPAFSAWNYAFGALLLPFVHLPGIDAWRANATNGWGIAVRVVRWFEPVVLWSLLIILGATFTTLVTRDQR